MYRPVRNLTNIILNLTVLILISTVTIVLFAQTNNQSSKLNFFGYKSFIISSGSMEPKFMTGSFVITKKVPKEQIKLGDMIAYQASDSILVFHRVVAVNDNGLTTKGDRLVSPDGSIVPYDMVIGKEFFHTNFFVNFYNKVKTVGGAIELVVLPLLSAFLTILGIKYVIKLRNG